MLKDAILIDCDRAATLLLPLPANAEMEVWHISYNALHRAREFYWP